VIRVKNTNVCGTLVTTSKFSLSPSLYSKMYFVDAEMTNVLKHKHLLKVTF